MIAADLEAFDPEYFSNLKWMLDNARGAQGGLGKGVKWRLNVVNFFGAVRKMGDCFLYDFEDVMFEIYF